MKPSDLWPTYGKLCSFRFADLRHNGELSLVASHDGGGTADCNEVSIFDRTPTGFEDFDVDGYADFSAGLDSGLHDLDHNGKLEVIIGEIVFGGLSEASNCGPDWPIIFAWQDGAYRDVSSRYRTYYEKQLARLKSRAAPESSAADEPSGSPIEQSLRESTTPNGSGLGHFEFRQIFPSPPRISPQSQEIPPCTAAVIGKLERYLGQSRDAGMDTAIKLADSDNPDDRGLAVSIFRDIATAESRRYLRSLTGDSDRNVARGARGAFEGIGNSNTWNYGAAREVYDNPHQTSSMTR
ncbi:MAG TPA: hypothetical protein VJN94_14730 [Candidatus Binataceae bacterium]|nr:hypothetical protein [Candidatus Binataceae bacterium]